jgi:hypothetical protein
MMNRTTRRPKQENKNNWLVSKQSIESLSRRHLEFIKNRPRLTTSQSSVPRKLRTTPGTARAQTPTKKVAMSPNI